MSQAQSEADETTAQTSVVVEGSVTVPRASSAAMEVVMVKDRMVIIP